MFGSSEAVYSGYTCYTGIADFVPADIETVGYMLYQRCIMSNVSPIYSSDPALCLITMQINYLTGTVYFWDTNNTLFLQMWEEERCNGMHFTMKHLVELMILMVHNLHMILLLLQHFMIHILCSIFILVLRLRHEGLFLLNKIPILLLNKVEHSEMSDMRKKAKIIDWG